MPPKGAVVAEVRVVSGKRSDRAAGSGAESNVVEAFTRSPPSQA